MLSCTHPRATPHRAIDRHDDDDATMWCPDCGAILDAMQTQDPP